MAKKRFMMVYAHRTQFLILQMYPSSDLGTLKYDSGMIRKFKFCSTQEALLLEPFSHAQPTTIATYGRVNGSTCQTTLGRT